MSYGYEEYLDITPEQILQKVSQQKIFEWILEDHFDFKKRYKSPFREHSKGKGTCRFEQREDGTILFVDFGDTITHRTCFKLLMDFITMKEGNECTLQEALKHILAHFNLSKNSSEYKDIHSKSDYIKENNSKDIKITYDPIPIERRHKIYISQFLIKPEHLIEDNVFPTNKFYVQKAGGIRRTISIFTLCFAIDFIDTVKIYQPYSTDYKWITNCNEDVIGNFDNLDDYGDELVIQKSWKDHRVVRNILFLKNIIYLQNEGMIPSMYILENLSKRFKLITIFFDNDDTGIKAALKLQDIFNKIRIASCRVIYLPLNLRFKDPSALVYKEGRQDTVKVFKQIGL